MQIIYYSTILMLAGMACSSESEKGQEPNDVVESTVVNNAPSQPILTIGPSRPTDDDELTASIVQDSTDPEGEMVTLTWKWARNGEIQPDITEPSVSSDLTEPGDEWTVYAIPFDGTQEGMSGYASVVISDNEEDDSEDPTSTELNTAPSSPIVAIAPSNPRTADSLTVGLIQDSLDPEGDTVEIEYKWVQNGVLVEGQSTETISADLTQSGDEWTVYAIPTDGTLFGAAGVATVVVGNTSPQATATISSSTPTTTEDIVVTATGTDVDNDTVEFEYHWTVNSQSVGNLGATLPASRTSKGEVWSVEVVPTDGTDDGTVVSLSATIQNTVPSLSTATVSEASPSVSSELECLVDGWADADNDPELYSVEWFVNGTSVSTSAILDGTHFVKGDAVHCVATPMDDDGSGSPVTAADVTVQNSNPVTQSVVLSSLTPTRSEVLMVTPSSTDADGDNVTHSYQWSVNGTIVSTASTLDVSTLVPGDEVTVTVVGNDGTVDGDSVVSATAIVQNAVPMIDSVTLTPANPTTTDELSVSFVATDADGDVVNAQIQWSVDGVVVSTAGANLSSSLFAKHQTVTAQLTPSDVYSTGLPYVTSVSIENSVPTITAATVTPTTATVSDVLICEATGWMDADGDAPVYTYEWLVNGSVNGSGNSLDASTLSAGDEAHCVILPNDGESDGAPMDSNVVTILNTAPVIQSAVLSTTSPYRADTLAITTTSVDADGDSLTENIDWVVNGSVVATGTSLSLNGYSVGDEIYAVVTVDDGTDSVQEITQTVTVLNHQPTIDSATLSDLTPDTNAVLTATISSSDNDGDGLTTSYQWQVNGNVVGTNSSLDGANYFSRGDTVSLLVTVEDGVGGVANMTLSATVQNSTPSVGSAFITPDPATAADSLECGAVGWDDADEDVEAYDVEWFVAGLSVSNAATITTPLIAYGDDVYCRLTPTDGLASGTPVDSGTLTIENSLPTIDSVTLSETSPLAGAVLTATLGTVQDVDGDTVTTAYSWTVNGAEVSTATSLDTAGLQGGDAIVLTVTPNDGNTNGLPAVANAQIFNALPVIDSLSLAPVTAYTNDVLTASATVFDADSSSLTIGYEWLVNGVLVSGETGATLSGTAYFAKGDTVEVRATGNDGIANGVPVSSSVTILNTVPTAPVVQISPNNPEGGSDDLVCTLQSPSQDADGDAIDYTFTWEVDGSSFTTVSDTNFVGDTIAGGETNQGETWTCTVDTHDGEDAGGTDSDDVAVQGCTPGLDELASFQIDSSTYCGAGNYYMQPWDWDGDGDTDLIVDDGNDSNTRSYVLDNHNGAFSLGWTSSFSLSGISSNWGSLANFDRYYRQSIDHINHDWNQDGVEELLSIGKYGNIYSTKWQNGLFVNQPVTGFAHQEYSMSGELIDYDGVPPLEIMIGSYTGWTLYAFDGSSFSTIDSYSSYKGFGALTSGDFDGDGFEEALIGTSNNNYNGSYLNLLNFDGSTHTITWSNSDGIGRVLDLRSADVNQDGHLDFLAVGTFGAWLYLNDGAGDFVLNWIAPEAATFESSMLEDINGDGWVDIILPSDFQQVSIYLNQNGNGFAALAHDYTGQGRAVSAMDFDNDGVNEVVFSKFDHDGVTPSGRNTCTTIVATLSCDE